MKTILLALLLTLVSCSSDNDKYDYLAYPYLCDRLSTVTVAILIDCVNLADGSKYRHVINPINILEVEEGYTHNAFADVRFWIVPTKK